MKRFVFSLFVAVMVPLHAAHGQFSAYGSLSTGYNANPLCNYERRPDQTRQAYVELKHATQFPFSRIDVQYVGGLMLFNSIEIRNYYEHALSGQYLLRFTGPVPPGPSAPDDSSFMPDAGSAADSEETEEPGDDSESPADGVTMAPPDSGSTTLETRLTLSSRHDKREVREFDNIGADIQGIFRTPLCETFSLRVTGTTGIREYTSLQELSNISAVLRLLIGNLEDRPVHLTVHLGGGIKQYLQSVYDTAKFEPRRSYVEKPAGKGKPGAKVTVPSDKVILTNPGSISSGQIMTGVDAGISWPGGSAQSAFLYRNNLGSSSRLLAQYVNSSFLTDDIYNDFFSYEGPELSLRVQQDLFFGIEAILSCSATEKTYNAPSFNLTGDQTHDHRADRRLELEMWVQKFIDLSDHSGMGLFLAGSMTRNQSNDDYNDFSGWSILGGVSIGIF